MRRERFILTVLVTILLLYYFLPFEWLGPRHGKYFVHPERPAILIERCQYLEKPLKGDEAEFHDEKYRLRGVMMVFRHGERSPVTKVDHDLMPDCSPYFDIDRRAFDSYTKLVKSDDFRNFLKTDSAYPSNFSWHPHSSKCSLGHMTAEGTLQHLKLASYLHEKYKLVDLFNNMETTEVFLTSTLYPRTFQSAIAFSSAFLYVLPNLKTVQLKASETTHFCMNSKAPCSCPKYDEIRKASEAERAQEFQSKTEPRLRDRIKSLAHLVGMKEAEHPLQFLDVILGRYACRRAHFPCHENGDCLTLNDIMEVADEGENISHRMYDTSSPVTRQMSVIEAFAQLNHLTAATRHARQVQHGPRFIKILSGHDISLEALMKTLNLKDRIPPHYASRVVFEIHEAADLIEGERVFVKVIFNGADQTANIDFCQPLVQGLCKALKFEQFVANDLFKLANIGSLKDVC